MFIYNSDYISQSRICHTKLQTHARTLTIMRVAHSTNGDDIQMFRIHRNVPKRFVMCVYDLENELILAGTFADQIHTHFPKNGIRFDCGVVACAARASSQCRVMMKKFEEVFRYDVN